MKILSLMTLLTLFVVFSCSSAKSNNDFPVLEGSGKPMATNYYVCKDEKSGEVVYHSQWCGDDTCWSNFYDNKGKLIEDTPEYGGGTITEYKVKTKVVDCKRTTKEYFATKASADNPREK